MIGHIGRALLVTALVGGVLLFAGRSGESEEGKKQGGKAPGPGQKAPKTGRERIKEWMTKPWTLKAPAFAIADNLYYVGNQRFASHLLVGEKEIVLIDTPYKEHFDLLTESIRSVGINPADVTLIIHTHYHYDHVGATPQMKELSGAIVAMGAEDIPLLNSPRTLRYLASAGVQAKPVDVERPLKQGDTIDLGNTVIHCHHTPGHTPGAMSFTFDVQIDGERHTAILYGAPGLNVFTMKGLYYKGAEEDFARSLDYLEKLEGDVFLGAHPFLNDTLGKYERLKKGEKPNPFIDREGWLKFLGKTKRGYEKLMSER